MRLEPALPGALFQDRAATRHEKGRERSGLRESMVGLAARCGVIAGILVSTPWTTRAGDSGLLAEERFAEALSPEYVVAREDEGGATPSFSFKSRRGSPSPEGMVHPRLRLRVTRHPGPGGAMEALRALEAEARESMFLKYPLLAVATGERLYRLDGSCALPATAWDDIAGRLLESLPPPLETQPHPRLRIACGGSILEAPRPAEGP